MKKLKYTRQQNIIAFSMFFLMVDDDARFCCPQLMSPLSWKLFLSSQIFEA